MIVKLLTEHHLVFLSLKGGCTGLSKSTQSLVKMSNCWKSHVAAQLFDLLKNMLPPGCSAYHGSDYFP